MVYAIALVEGVYAVTPVLALRTVLDGAPVTAYGVDPQTFEEVYGALNLVEGGFLSCSDCYEVVVGRTLSEELGLSVGSRLALTAGNASLELTAYGGGRLDQSEIVSLLFSSLIALSRNL